KNYAEAEKKLRRALELDRNHNRALCNLGLVLGHQKRYQEAFQAFRAAGVSEADAHCNLGFVYWSQGKLDDARRECKAALEKRAGSTKPMDMLAQLDRPMGARGKGKDRPTARGPGQSSRPPVVQESIEDAVAAGNAQTDAVVGEGGQRYVLPA